MRIAGFLRLLALSLGALLASSARAQDPGAPSIEVSVKTATVHQTKDEGTTLTLYFTRETVEPQAKGVMIISEGRLTALRDDHGETIAPGKYEIISRQIGSGAFVARPKDEPDTAAARSWRERKLAVPVFKLPPLPSKLAEVALEFKALIVDESKLIDVPEQAPGEGVDLLPGLHLDFASLPNRNDDGFLDVRMSYTGPYRPAPAVPFPISIRGIAADGRVVDTSTVPLDSTPASRGHYELPQDSPAIVRMQVEVITRVRPVTFRVTGKDVSIAQPFADEAGRMSLDELKAALDQGADPNEISPDGGTPLCGVIPGPFGKAKPDMLDAVRLLLAKGANPNPIDGAAYAPLDEALVGASRELIMALVDAGADPNRAPLHKDSPMVTASLFADVAVMQVLLDHGGDPFTRGHDGRTLLHNGRQRSELSRGWPNRSGYSVLIGPFAHAALGDKGAESAKGDQITPLMGAAYLGNMDRVRTELTGSTALAQDRDGWTALHWAAASPEANENVFRALIKGGANPNQADNAGRIPLSIAVMYGGPAAIEALSSVSDLIGKADTVDRGDVLRSPLLFAAACGKPGALERLLREPIWKQPHTKPVLAIALSLASERTDADLLEPLLAAGASPDGDATWSRRGQTPLVGALRAKDMRRIRALANAGADWFLKDPFGYLPFQFVVEAGDDESFGLMLGARAKNHLMERRGSCRSIDNALLLAAQYKRAQWCKSLLDFGAKPGAITNLYEASTAMIGAAGSGDDNILRLMLDNGGRFGVLPSLEEQTLVDAKAKGRDAIAALMTDHGVDGTGARTKRRAALLSAIQQGTPDLVRELAQGIDLNAPLVSKPPLVDAVIFARPETVRLLLDLGAKPEPPIDESGYSAAGYLTPLAAAKSRCDHNKGDPSATKILGLIQEAMGH
jgi:ankyrin repeat protein